MMKIGKLLAVIATMVCSLLGFLYVLDKQPDVLLTSLTKKNVIYSSNWEFSRSRQRIAIIDSSGYIGSRLFSHLQEEKSWTVIGYDGISSGKTSSEIATEELRTFQVVIYVDGSIDRAVEQENVLDAYELAKSMLSAQLLIFASTSDVTEGSGFRLVDENSLRNLSFTSNIVPQIVGLRFGSVIDLSESQPIDFAHMTLVCQAFLSGRIRAIHPESERTFLCIEDLVQAITILIKHSNKAKRFDLFHLQSFPASISNIANAVASRTGAYVDASDHSHEKESYGSALDTTKFRTTFDDFVFEGNQDKIITRLIEDAPRICLGHKSHVDNDSTPCVVCGSRVMHTVIDLHSQPLANDFRNRVEESLKCERFPLRLVRCPKCHHTQLSYLVDRAYLFSHYLYQSGTSGSLKAYFKWLAEKIIDESGKTNGTVLEVACNDGSQLNQFSKHGWKTIGVDPAKNLAELARKQGHIIYTGFWGVDQFPLLPSPDELDVIIAQNVFAHVEDPVQFLRGCVAAMSVNTKLYIQTSQCEMYETGQFDTVYHEHISFFTAHSFKKAADIVGLKIVNFEITPIHGRSCLVTFQRRKISDILVNIVFQEEDVPSLSLAIEKERKLGVTEPWFYVKYQAQTEGMRQWILYQLASLHEQDHTIVAYGAAAKGMVLLHFLLESSNRTWNISYVIDDAPLKQNTYCPGTSIPVLPTSTLRKHTPNKPLTVIIFAWNFWEEISQKIRQQTVDRGMKSVFIMLPFPQQRLIKVEQDTTLILAQNIYKPLPWPSVFISDRRPILLISHFFNEEFLLPYWIRHHASMFDMAILIDYNSTDRSLEILRREAPHTWKIVPSHNIQFDVKRADAEVQEYEKKYPSAWKIVLNTPEFLVHPDLRQTFSDVEHSSAIQAFRFRSIIMSGNDSTPLQQFTSLLKQRSQYLCDTDNHAETIYSRYIHRYPYAQYALGRHEIPGSIWEWFPAGFIAKFQYTPWPEIINRKLQIRSRIPSNQFSTGLNSPHNVNAAQLSKRRDNVQRLPQCDLREYTALNEELKMIHRLWREVIDH